MSKCPNCDLPLSAAPWRYDAHEHGVHWVCPTDERVRTEELYAPIRLSAAINEYMQQHGRRSTDRRLPVDAD